jgi:hypothetical protein
MSLGPVDPTRLTVHELADRATLILRYGVQPPSEPLPPGCYRCLICWRTAEMSRTYDEALASHRRRFGRDVPENQQVILCDDCNRIISVVMGYPL